MQTKQLILLRKDLNMRKGKMVAQGAHASMAAIFKHRSFANMDMLVADAMNKEYSPDAYELDTMLISLTPYMKDWLMGKFTKICVSVDSEEELLALYDKAKEDGKVGIILNVQNTVCLSNDINRLDLLNKMGVWVVQLTYNLK